MQSKPFRNKSERNADVLTFAHQIFHNAEIITSRLDNMTMDEYRLLKKHQDKIIKKIFSRKPTRNHPLPQRLGYNLHIR